MAMQLTPNTGMPYVLCCGDGRSNVTSVLPCCSLSCLVRGMILPHVAVEHILVLNKPMHAVA